MLSGPLPLPAHATPDPGPEAAAGSVLSLFTALARLLVSMDAWPEDHHIRLDGSGQRAPPVIGRVTAARQVIDVLFDPTTGQFLSLAVQPTAVDWPAGLGVASAEGSFLGAVVKGLAGSVAAALLQSPQLVEVWSGADPTLARCNRSDNCWQRSPRSTGWRCACSS
ncbi:hypothetical protein [Mitsuaria sp. GD03876]|uniref:hypothetical protein n=1 Tax=Mitsuaria sp. GD03876 TaxID=2975399 RepID=UPI00244BA29D|nr:hypothetical protein [Mitsuaria sp. GD03876]MDH0863895.1 hypothetical protein [Mitsuaria sp. GD03876]